MQKCQVCGKENPAGVEYCEDCGASLAAAAPAPAAPPPAAGVEPPGTVPAAAPTPAAAPRPAAPGQSPGPASAAGGPGPAPAAAGAPAAAAPAPAAPPAGNGSRPRLAVKRFGALTGEEIPLMAERLLVGRFDSETGPVDIDLSAAPESDHISRQHGELYRETDGRWFVRDLGSTNGVFVKGTSDATFGPRLTAPREIASGDELAFGNARFVFRTD